MEGRRLPAKTQKKLYTRPHKLYLLDFRLHRFSHLVTRSIFDEIYRVNVELLHCVVALALWFALAFIALARFAATYFGLLCNLALGCPWVASCVRASSLRLSLAAVVYR